MPANIAIDARTGQAMAAYAIKPAWHGLGAVIDHNMTVNEALKAAHMDWGTSKVPAYAKVKGRFVEATDHVALIRDDTGQVMGFSSPDFQTISNKPYVETMRNFHVDGAAVYADVETMFAIGTGSKCGATLDLKGLNVKVPGDPSKIAPKLILTWAHDATEACRAGFWYQRIECANMRGAFLADADSGRTVAVRITHTGDVKAKLQEAKRVLGLAADAAVDYAALMKALIDTPAPMINTKKGRDWWDAFLDGLGYATVDANGVEMARPGHRTEARDTLTALYADSKTLKGVPFSAYRVLQAVDEYADHYKPLRVQDPNLVAERAFRSQIDGGAATELKDKALDLLIRSFGIDATPAAAAVLVRR